MPLADIVREAVERERNGQFTNDDQAPHSPYPGSPKSQTKSYHGAKDSVSSTGGHARKRSYSTRSPGHRTGPPASISYNYSLPGSRRVSRTNSRADDSDAPQNGPVPHGDDIDGYFSDSSQFRGALEYSNPEQREKEREAVEKRQRRRESKIFDEDWNPKRWFFDSPREEKQGFDWGEKEKERERDREKEKEKEKDKGKRRERSYTSHVDKRDHVGTKPASSADDEHHRHSESDIGRPGHIPRSQSLPHIKSTVSRSSTGAPPWKRLRSLIPHIAGSQSHVHPPQAGSSVVPAHMVNITDELITGGLATLMLRLWFERDEKDLRRVPILLHRLRIKVSDSLHPLEGHKSVFRIECEYANGASRWVIYRQLRDFISLHTHYALSNAFNSNVETLPEFPRTSLPYFKFLKKEGRIGGRADFARMQREALENYLVGLIRAVMFHPTSNRLAGFLEISALSIVLAQSGGVQHKAGYLRVESAGNKAGGFGRKGTSWKERKEQRWCAIRESYLVVMEEPGELKVLDVFMLDPDFKIERPKRYYRQGLNLLHPETQGDMLEFGGGQERDHEHRRHPHHDHEHHEHHERREHSEQHERAMTTNGFCLGLAPHDDDRVSMVSTIRSRVSKAFHFKGHGRRRSDSAPNALSRARSSSTSSSSSVSSDEHSSDEEEERAGMPMMDPSTNMDSLTPRFGGDGPGDGEHGEAPRPPNEDEMEEKKKKKKGKTKGKEKKKKNREVSKHTFYIENSQMRLKLYARNERQMLQWIAALEKAARTSHFAGSNRFESFAPIRLNVAAQWLVDGRDYMWNLSRAILLARECIYIHDWWLSPELQMRRPNMDKYRLDRLLERKAKEGVKIYIILYQEVSSRTTPTDSNYTKQRLTALHENIMVQRSPSHFQTGTFYWAHHEKLCVIDQAIAFMGGIDLCFGRWDTPQHIVVDDPENEGEPQVWPGKDYSNARVLDFHTLNKPYDDMYDRTKVPRMPWHDVGLQIVGQPARDLARHFVQRWNWLLRIKNHSRLMPFLLPPSDFKPGELTEMGLTGTLEMQICRSAGPWSLGTPMRVERSIQNAYLKAIQMSEHFVYIENQFFVTSTTVNDVKIENRIGDAIVHRAIRAHREGRPWRCCVMVPCLPGFAYSIDHNDASSLRIIVECQNRTMFRGPDSIFGRLRKEGINPDDHIGFFSLRNWGKLRGDVLTTEIVYIHGKVCIVDDRLAIIGSANINERSQRGDRDSEIATVIRDTDMIDGTMAGKAFKVGRFAHTLRVRLMREHVGVDVDALDEEDLMANAPVQREHEQEEWDPDSEQERGQEETVTHLAKPVRGSIIHDTIDEMEQAVHGMGEAYSKDASRALGKAGLKTNEMDATASNAVLQHERTTYNRSGEPEHGFASAQVPTLEEEMIAEERPPREQTVSEPIENELHDTEKGMDEAEPPEARVDGELFGAPAEAAPSAATDKDFPHPSGQSQNDDADEEEREAPSVRKVLREHLTANLGSKWTLPTPRPIVDPDGFEDPICDEFWKNVWVASAVHNTEIYRKVFHAIPDDLVTTWKQYKEFVAHHERLNKPSKETATPEPVARVPSEAGDTEAPGHDDPSYPPAENTSPPRLDGDPVAQGADNQASTTPPPAGSSDKDKDKEARTRKGAKGDEPFEKWEKDEMEKLLNQVNGHLVVYPSRFLEGEDIANNFLFNTDRLLPMPIYD